MQVGWFWSMLPFDIVNAGVFLALVLNVLSLSSHAADRASPSRPRAASPTEILFVALLLWWLPRDFGEVALWKTGAIGYLWAITGELWVLRLLVERRPPHGFAAMAGGFVIATFLESISLFVSGVLLLWCLRCRHVQKPVPWGLLAAHAAGTTVLLAAPGNFARADTMSPSPPLDRLIGVVGNLGSIFDAWWLLAAAAVAMAYGSRWRWRALAAGKGWIFIPAALFYMMLLLGVPRSALAARLSFPASVFLVCYWTALFIRRPVTPRGAWRGPATLAGLCVLHALIVIPHLGRLADISRGWTRDPVLRSGPRADVILPFVLVEHRLFYARKDRFFEGITEDPDNFRNVCFAKVFGLKSVVARPD
ncbi:hypothetical protein AA13595_0364 [Gluconacetobacter johannae DSM 13595]|nr:hypothetical protein AA13595_0364 [Gluconacetobacter johannae DSM 13595]